MPGLKRLGLLILVLFGPGSLIYFLAKNVENKFVELPYLGEHHFEYDANGNVSDSTLYTIPNFNLTTIKGEKITRNSFKDKFLVVTTIQNSCPDDCGMYFLHYDEIFYSKLSKNTDSYDDVIVLTVLTDHDGNPVDKVSDKLIEEVKQIEGYDPNLWVIATGDPKPLFDFKIANKHFYELPSTPDNDEVGTKAFINSMLLIDKQGHIRGFTGARSYSDVSNYFDILKVLKKVDFDEKRGVR
jgi:cytochrome oxidase Cu insertion factor (SCO1/SenC/PrrC family)